MSRIRLLPVYGLFLSVVMIVAVTLSKPAVAAPCDAPAEVSKIIVMADWLPWSVQGPMRTAKINGHLQAEGLDLEILSPPHPADAVKLAARERVHFSLATQIDMMLAREMGIPVKSVAVLLREDHRGFIFLEGSGFKTPADLKGKIIGVGVKQDQVALARTLLKSAGLTFKDVKVIDPGFGHKQLLLTGKVDAVHEDLVYLGPMYSIEAKKMGLTPTTGFEYSDYGGPKNYFIVMLSHDEWPRNHPHATCRFLRAMEKGAIDFIENSEPAVAEIAKANEIFNLEQHNMVADVAKMQLKNKAGKFWVQDADTWQNVQDWALREKLITVPSDPNDYFTNEYLVYQQ